MKKYLKPTTEVMYVETNNHLLSASGYNVYDDEAANESDPMGKKHDYDFSVWDTEETEY